jgi:ATP-dependent protease HslVU (ClpYQ) peptidase subunit
MTCIVGLVDKGEVFMAGDSCASVDSGSHRELRKSKKVFRNGDFLIGGCGSFRMLQLLEHSFEPPEKSAKSSDLKYLVNDFMQALVSTFENHGFNEKTSGGLIIGGEFLVGYNGKLYHVREDFDIGEIMMNYDACGSGSGHALGSLYSSAGKKPMDRLKLSLEAAAAFVPSVAGPFYYEKL